MRRKRVAAYVTGLLSFITFARAGTLFLESLAAEREERGADLELLELCKVGSAKSSAKMRQACLAAASDRASPIVLKALMRALTRAFTEFRESVSSPLGMLTALLFLLSSLILPVVPFIKTLACAMGQDDDQDYHRDGDIEKQHIIVFGNDASIAKPGMRMRMRRLLTGPSER